MASAATLVHRPVHQPGQLGPAEVGQARVDLAGLRDRLLGRGGLLGLGRGLDAASWCRRCGGRRGGRCRPSACRSGQLLQRGVGRVLVAVELVVLGRRRVLVPPTPPCFLSSLPALAELVSFDGSSPVGATLVVVLMWSSAAEPGVLTAPPSAFLAKPAATLKMDAARSWSTPRRRSRPTGALVLLDVLGVLLEPLALLGLLEAVVDLLDGVGGLAADRARLAERGGRQRPSRLRS
jgi:hypothetical protein